MNMATQHHYEAIDLPRDEEGPVFDKPWQAQIFSLTVHLHQAGCFTWREWVQAFSEEIKAAPAMPEESVNDAYYRQWAAAMEKMMASLGFTGEDDISQRAQAWRQAYLNTPHGQPVLLAHADCPPAHPHDHHHSPQRAPVAVSPAFSG
ncbi:nitrile hydratase accessory protein [Brenneria izbisi]|uniref:Nitrile hydratase accessory protein n=1 Tax=Brenneria izbisi TaxID=2939450 RepID=A0AA41Y3X2_9GAMM|nr:nitrile hydratase accessory protein [Brenneria izbisi]MCV9880242.1 nitrile hydratase accessory protein [Brenneria izbisi]MCV9883652.1 nitrile hydratase accessory protein [Brenneria izbisi]